MTYLSNRLGSLAFTEKEKASLFSVMNFDKFPFSYREVSGDLILRYENYGGPGEPQRPQPRLAPWIVSSKPIPASEIRFTFHHPVSKLSERAAGRVESLWEAIFPFPFSQLVPASQSGFDLRLDVEPPQIKTALQSLGSSLGTLERKLSETEIAYLHLKSARGEICLVTRHVRRKRLALGILDLAGRSETETQGALGIFLAAQTAYFVISIESKQDMESQIQTIGSSFREAEAMSSSQSTTVHPHLLSARLPQMEL